MPDRDSLDDQPFSRKQAPQALLAAVTALAAANSDSLEAMEGMTLGEIARLAVNTYGDDLPPFWETWLDWGRDQTQPTGEL